MKILFAVAASLAGVLAGGAAAHAQPVDVQEGDAEADILAVSVFGTAESGVVSASVLGPAESDMAAASLFGNATGEEVSFSFFGNACGEDNLRISITGEATGC